MAADTRNEVVGAVRAHADEIRALGVHQLWLFGSFQRGTPSVASDVDLLVEFTPGRKTYENFSALADMLEIALGRRVELVTREALSPYIGPRILASAERILAA